MDAQELQAQAARLKNQVRDLTTERTKLAPLAMNGFAGGPEARTRIGEIDRERAALMLDLETVEAALQSPEFKWAPLIERLEAAFKKNFARSQANLINALAARYESLLVGANFFASGGPPT
jgi:hypothetical protein